MSALELRQLAYFVAVARHLNFTRAAAELHIAQPSLSEQIRRLEQDLGCQLFDRDRRRVRLTRAGETLLPHAQRILAQVRAAHAELRDQADLRSGRVELGALPTVVLYRLPALMAELRRRHPGLDVRVYERGTGELLAALDRDAIELAVVTLPVDPQRFSALPLLTERLLLIMAKQHASAEAAAGRRSLREFADHPFIQYEEGYGLRQLVADTCRRAGFEPRIACESGSTETIKRFVAAGLGVGLVPESVLEAHDLNRLVALVPAEEPTRTLALVSRRGRHLSAAARATAALIREGFARWAGLSTMQEGS